MQQISAAPRMCFPYRFVDEAVRQQYQIGCTFAPPRPEATATAAAGLVPAAAALSEGALVAAAAGVVEAATATVATVATTATFSAPAVRFSGSLDN